MSFSQTPAYNLKVILKETGIKADVLRAWERRYGLPMPQRSAGGHRLYSQRDTEIIRWLMARQGEGLSISRAVDLWRELEMDGRDPLAESRQTAGAAQAAATPPTAQPSLETACRDWLAACLAFNEPLAEQTLNQAFALHPVETVCVEVLQKGLIEIGNLWYENRASVQQEHFASALVMRRLNALLAAAPPPTRSQTILVGCPPDEWHSFPSLLMALSLRRRGFNVVYLGANVPDQRFEETVQAVHADLVLLAAQQLITAATLQQTVAALKAHGVNVGYSGRIFNLQPDLQTRIAGHFLGANLMDAMERVYALMATRPEAPKVVLPPPEYSETLQAFLANRAAIDASMEARTVSLYMSLQEMAVANHFMGDNLAAVLRLGNMTYMDSETNWLTSYLAARKSPLGFVPVYFKAYLGAVHERLGAHAGPVAEWLERQIEMTKDL